MTTVDEKDLRILRELEANAKQTTGKISKKTGIPVTTVHNRIKRFEKDGIIRKYAPVLDYGKLGQGIHALIFLTAQSAVGREQVSQSMMAAAAMKLPGIMSAKIITGEYDLVLDARVESVEILNKLLVERIRGIKGVEKTQTALVLEEFSR